MEREAITKPESDWPQGEPGSVGNPHTVENWDAMIQAKTDGWPVFITRAVYWNFLEVLPPVFDGRFVTLDKTGEKVFADFGFAEGSERIVAFWKTKDGHYKMAATTWWNRGY